MENSIKRIESLEYHLDLMKECMEYPEVETCVCFFHAFKILEAEIEDTSQDIQSLNVSETEIKRIGCLKKEVNEICKSFKNKPSICLNHMPCRAEEVFKEYPKRLDELYRKGVI
ncbi:MAG: hypothetical protein HY929_06595 [Euryarchaeota archaeon]|nr:hypothetical protein [Euryarchaeota archaeon]